ncbi:hypothetical protein Q0M94_25850 (plasmid) [Deinococcus radiomollis]|uniref:hypothetical protein n=1 Tax=Deinococcus radiomollis TaxID=468916 RepID=UPI003892B209
MTNRMLINTLPQAAVHLEALLHDEKEVGTVLEAGVIYQGTTNTYMPAMAVALKTVVEEQPWASGAVVEAEWCDFAEAEWNYAAEDTYIESLICWIHIREHQMHDPSALGRGLRLEVIPSGIPLYSEEDETEFVNVACPKLILDRLVSRQ